MVGVFRRPHHPRPPRRFVPTGPAAAPTVGAPAFRRHPALVRAATLRPHRMPPPPRVVVITAPRVVQAPIIPLARIVMERHRKILRERLARKPEPRIVPTFPPAAAGAAPVIRMPFQPVRPEPRPAAQRALVGTVTPAAGVGMTPPRRVVRAAAAPRVTAAQRPMAPFGLFVPGIGPPLPRTPTRAPPPQRAPYRQRPLVPSGPFAPAVGAAPSGRPQVRSVPTVRVPLAPRPLVLGVTAAVGMAPPGARLLPRVPAAPKPLARRGIVMSVAAVPGFTGTPTRPYIPPPPVKPPARVLRPTLILSVFVPPVPSQVPIVRVPRVWRPPFALFPRGAPTVFISPVLEIVQPGPPALPFGPTGGVAFRPLRLDLLDQPVAVDDKRQEWVRTNFRKMASYFGDFGGKRPSLSLLARILGGQMFQGRVARFEDTEFPHEMDRVPTIILLSIALDGGVGQVLGIPSGVDSGLANRTPWTRSSIFVRATVEAEYQFIAL